ncbi:MAG: RnfABCDGE type electron transport complex subunit D [Desulfocapsaceae bacterium]|jgi:electron transport complex protein RnfD|nr:RnfABCDGE type electron transport complex subunit D [Desulfocapsaceae bacterium]
MKELKMFDPTPPMDRSMLDVAVGPHCRLGTGLAEIYQRWVIALVPAMAASLYLFGAASFRVFGLCVCFSVAFDFICEKFAPSRDLTSNWSSVSLALILAFMLPLNAPWWLIMIGCLLMVVVGKKFFGGVGAYPVQPAVLAVAVMQLSWPERMDYTAALKNFDWSVTMIEPLRLAKSIGSMAADQYEWYDLLFGYQVSGTACGMVFFILIGGLLLLLMREIQWHAPVGFFIGFTASAGLLHMLDPLTFGSPLFYLLSGGTVFMGLFLITDHTTTPVNNTPLFIYGLFAGMLLVLIRGYSRHVDGIAYTVLLVNLCAPLLDMIRPKTKGASHV